MTLPHATRALLARAHEMKERIVFTNGCFDILHVGHLRLLQGARDCGDILIVGLNSDASMTAYKREPIIPQDERMEMLRGIRWVDDVVLFESIRCDELIRAIKPHVYYKRGYQNTQDPEEWSALFDVGAEIILPPATQGISTTEILHRMGGGLDLSGG